MFESLQNASIMVQGAVISVLGLLLVFAVLVLFFLSIRILGRIPNRRTDSGSNPVPPKNP